MLWLHSTALGLMTLLSAWMLFDGSRALVVGDYITPKEGPYAGQLGPWAKVLQSVGLDPRSTPIKIVFIVQGLLGLVAVAGFFLGFSWGWRGVLIMSLLALWYLPVGTAMGLIILVLLFLSHRFSPG